MNAQTDPNKPSRFWLLSIAALLAAAVLISGAFDATQAAGKEPAVVTYTRGVLHVAIPYDAPHAGGGQLTVEVLDPEDQVLGRTGHHAGVAQGSGRWQEDIRLAKAPSIEDLVWHRVRYRFAYADAREAADGGHRIHLADPAHAGDAYPRPAILPGRRTGGGARHRHRFEERGHRRRRARCASNCGRRRSRVLYSPAA